MSIVSEFRDFIRRGSVIDLAVGVIIGGAFGKIVSSATEDLIMPIVSLFTGKIDYSEWYVPLSGQAADLTLAEAKKAGAVFAYGNFLTALINFLIVAFVIFLIVKKVNRMMPPPPPPEPQGPPPQEVYLKEIRDLLAKRA
jgi:large conductance mechanosensitive channel